jgi:hypothetical protein
MKCQKNTIPTNQNSLYPKVMKVTLRLQNEIFKVDIEPTTSLNEFRQVVARQTHIPESQQILEVDIDDEIVPMKEGH